MKSVDQPALFIATQTTIPTLTSIASALCLGAIALAASDGWPGTVMPWLDVPSTNLAILLLSVAAFAFLLTAHCCVSSHAWDIHAMSDQRRSDWEIDQTPEYTQRCIERCMLWHVLAAYSYNTGSTFLLLGLCVLFLDVAPVVSLLAVIFLVTSLVDWLCRHSLACMERREALVRRLVSLLLKR